MKNLKFFMKTKEVTKKYWKSVYNRCASLIYRIWLQYNIVEISQYILRSHKIFWDLTRSFEISQDLLRSHKANWDFTRPTVSRSCELSKDLLRSHKIYWDLTRSADISQDHLLIWHNIDVWNWTLWSYLANLPKNTTNF